MNLRIQREAISLSLFRSTFCPTSTGSTAPPVFSISICCTILPGRIGSDFYILPSSVHEVLLIPADNQISMSTLSSMGPDVNSSQLAREEILSDHVYYYSLETDQITM